MSPSAVSIHSLSHRYGQTLALDNISLTVPQGVTVGLIGPDGVGKSTLLSLIAGVRIIQEGNIEVFGANMADKRVRNEMSSRIAFMPQGLGRNLYPTLSVYENVDFHGSLFGLRANERKQRIFRLLEATGLSPFLDRAAGKLSGGMKQKLSLCCALIHSPDLLILDEPTTGVDPLSRRQFWALVNELQAEHQDMTVIVATAYIDEAEQFEHLLAMDDGKLLVNKPTKEVIATHGTKSLEEAYIKMLPKEKQQNSAAFEITPFISDPDSPPAIEAYGLTKRFGSFVAVDNVSFKIEKGEIFGFLGSNGCGKSTTMKMLTGLLVATEGSAKLLGQPIEAGNAETRMRVGYMSQAFSLYEELTVRQNLNLHAKLYQIDSARSEEIINNALRQFDLINVADVQPTSLPLGIRQRLQLAAACLHRPEVLILDEPTSGVDPSARDMFWSILLKLSRENKITIFVSTHFMNELERCDRVSLMHRGRVLAVGTPTELVRQSEAPNTEEAFIHYLKQDVSEDEQLSMVKTSENNEPTVFSHTESTKEVKYSSLLQWLASVWVFAVREAKELMRDKVRIFFAMIGPVILMIAMVWSISFDLHNISFTVFDQDKTVESRYFTEYFSGSKYFKEEPPVNSLSEADYAIKSAQANMLIEIPDGFGRDLQQRRQPEISFSVDGAEPFNASTISGYIESIMSLYAQDKAVRSGQRSSPPAGIEERFMYNQEFKSIVAIAPGILVLVLMMVPAMMSVIGVVREREIGSITNFYTSPATIPQFLLGKQLPYIATGMLNYILLLVMIIYWFGVPLKGEFFSLTLGTLTMISMSTGMGLLISCFVRSQVAAIIFTAIVTMVPTFTFSGILYPVSSMEGGAYIIGRILPAHWYVRITIGSFAKGLGLSELWYEMLILTAYYLGFLLSACLILKKQEK